MSQQLIDAVIDNNMEEIEKLLNQNVDINYIGKGKITPVKNESFITAVTALSMAVHLGHKDIAQKLLKGGAKIDPYEGISKDYKLERNATNAAALAVVSTFNQNMLGIYYQLVDKLSMQFKINSQYLHQFIAKSNKEFLKIIMLHLMSLEDAKLSITKYKTLVKLTKSDLAIFLENHGASKEVQKNLLGNIQYIKGCLTEVVANEMTVMVNDWMRRVPESVNLKLIIDKLSLFNSQSSEKSKGKLRNLLEKIENSESAKGVNLQSLSDETKGRLRLFQSTLTDNEREKFMQDVRPTIKCFLNKIR